MSGAKSSSGAAVAAACGAVVAVWLLVALAYWPALSAGFVSDDFLILRRLAEHAGLQNPASYFGLRHFEYYRPLAFLSLAADWQVWGRSAFGYHATALLLHAVNVLLVFVLSRRLMGIVGAAAAAALFAVHPSSHEAVIWVSSRFDLLGTAWLLTGLFVSRWRNRAGGILAAAAFLAAVLSKESALALPVVATAAMVMLQGSRGRRILMQLALFTLAALVYSLMRQGAGLPWMGGAARLPKLLVLVGVIVWLLFIAQLGWHRVWSVVAARRRGVGLAVVGVVAAAGLFAWVGPLTSAFRGALASVLFAAAHLVSPVSLDSLVGTLPSTIWLAGWCVLAATAAAVVLWWRLLDENPSVVFLIVFLVAALVPVSSMTEGTRYLYLASVPAAMLVGRLLDTLSGRRLTIAAAVLLAVLSVNVWQVRAKAADWQWAAEMTEASATTIAASLGDRCEGRDIILLTAPVRVRGAYSNLNLESLAWFRNCVPSSVRIVVRAGLSDPRIDIRWPTPAALEWTAHNYDGTFVTSRDLRTFDVLLDGLRPQRFATPIGLFEVTPDGRNLVMQLSFEKGPPQARFAWFYYSDGAVRAVPPPLPR